ncbi:hypothetical protein NPIL_538231, partial [Nephila pilipes]
MKETETSSSEIRAVGDTIRASSVGRRLTLKWTSLTPFSVSFVSAPWLVCFESEDYVPFGAVSTAGSFT